jgi:hypothetical protein
MKDIDNEYVKVVRTKMSKGGRGNETLATYHLKCWDEKNAKEIIAGRPTAVRA